ncbi:MAG: two-component system sensor histidine kinase NtrB [Candidatus Zixiibacteriota bacterium]
MREDIHKELNKKLHWLLISRFTLFIVVFIAVLISQPKESYIYYLLLFYGAATASYIIALFRRQKEKPYASFRFLCTIPLVFEILIELALVHMTGGVQSPYIFLFALSIITAAFIYRLSGTLIVTAISSLLYSLMVFFQYKGYIDFELNSPGLELLYTNPDALFFSVYIFICFLFIIAFLSGYLSRKLHLQVEKIRNLDTELSKLKLSTNEIMEHLTNGVVVIDKTGMISYFNKTAQKILDVNYSKIENRDYKTALQKDLPEIFDMIQSFISHETMKSYKNEVILRNKSNKTLNIKISISSLDIDNQDYGTIVILEDVTSEMHRKNLIQQMEKQAAIGDISARFAHEIRNPLASIRGSVEMLMGNINLPPEDKRLFELVIRESDRLTNLLEAFLSFARLKEIPDEQFNMGKVDIGATIDELIMLWKQHPAFHSGIKITNKIKPSEMKVRGQDEQLAKAFSNIIINSMQAIGEDSGEITISGLAVQRELFNEEKMAGITIEDTGCGIEKEDIKNIFTPFYSKKNFGSGLGMAIANSVINKHNGYIDIDSEIGKGTKITIYLNAIDKKK